MLVLYHSELARWSARAFSLQSTCSHEIQWCELPAPPGDPRVASLATATNATSSSSLVVLAVLFKQGPPTAMPHSPVPPSDCTSGLSPTGWVAFQSQRGRGWVRGTKQTRPRFLASFPRPFLRAPSTTIINRRPLEWVYDVRSLNRPSNKPIPPTTLCGGETFGSPLVP